METPEQEIETAEVIEIIDDEELAHPALDSARAVLNPVLKSPLLFCLAFAIIAIYTFLLAMNASGAVDSSSFLKLLLFAIFSFMLGVSCTLYVIKRCIHHAREHLANLDEHLDEASDPRHAGEAHLPAEAAATGLTDFDDLIHQMRRTITHLLQSLAGLGDEVHDFVERYELLTNNLSAAVIIRRPEQDVMFCSPYTEVLTGYSLDEIYQGGTDFLDELVLDEDRARYQRAKQICELGEDIAVRYQIRHRSGITLWIETHLVPVFGEHAEVESILSVSIDVTTSVRYQQRIEEQNRDLNDFTYMVSHDLKAPIFTIKGMAALILEDFGAQLDAEGQESLNHIVSAADRLEKLIKSVIEYSQLSTKDIETKEIDLDIVIANVLADLKQQIKDSDAQITVPEDLPVVIGDELRLYQVFSNLLGNALKYRDRTRVPEISLAVRHQTEEELVVDVIDNGLGIPEEKIDDVFRPYHRAHGNEIEGSGVGLACVKKILDRIGGAVVVDSTEGTGSVFTVKLRRPAAQAEPQEETGTARFDATTPLSSL
ncbi:MAG: PAS domain-containing protein [Bdellovibrionales bacterium]|nr:PAS domain-containing protein [Bdellovibrionales bacterium]